MIITSKEKEKRKNGGGRGRREKEQLKEGNNTIYTIKILIIYSRLLCSTIKLCTV